MLPLPSWSKLPCTWERNHASLWLAMPHWSTLGLGQHALLRWLLKVERTISRSYPWHVYARRIDAKKVNRELRHWLHPKRRGECMNLRSCQKANLDHGIQELGFPGTDNGNMTWHHSKDDKVGDGVNIPIYSIGTVEQSVPACSVRTATRTEQCSVFLLPGLVKLRYGLIHSFIHWWFIDSFIPTVAYEEGGSRSQDQYKGTIGGHWDEAFRSIPFWVPSKTPDRLEMHFDLIILSK